MTALAILAGFALGAGIILHLVGRKVTAAEIDRREQAQRRALVRVMR